MNPVALLRALRPHQWSKNLFVLAAPVFAFGDRLTELPRSELGNAFAAFVAFCFASSAVYLLNDIFDVERDRLHPEKCKRPIAAGEITIGLAGVTAVVLALAAFGIGFWVGGEPMPVALVLLGYLLLNVAYSFKLKHVVLVDAFCIATGFLLRVVAGGAAAHANISHWLLLCTLFLALFLGLEKRRAEIDRLGEDSGGHRKTLDEYTPAFLDQMVTVLAACTILCYAMYAVDHQTGLKFGPGRLMWTVPFVTFGVGRYMYLVQTGRGGDSPTKIFLGGDPWFLLNSLAWAGIVVGIVLTR